MLRRRSQFSSSLLVAVALFGGHPIFERLAAEEGLIVGEDQSFPIVVITPDIVGLHGGARRRCIL